MIKLKGNLDWELTRFGVKEGDMINEHTKPGETNGDVFFDIRHNGFTHTCVVWPENYEIIVPA